MNFVKNLVLVDVFPDASAYNLSDGILRRNYPGDSESPARIEIELWPTSNVFLESHQIRLEISSSNFPRYDQNLNTGENLATASRSKIAHQEGLHSIQYPSHIVLPLVPAKSEQI